MKLTDQDQQRIRRRLGNLAPRFWGLPLTIVPLMGLMLAMILQGVDNHGQPLKPSVYVGTGLIAAFAMGMLIYFMPGLSRQYLGLRRDLREGSKEAVLAPLRRKHRQMWNNHTQSYYLYFDFGRVEVGQKLYNSLHTGQLLTLVLSKHGRELLAISEVEVKTVPWQL